MRKSAEENIAANKDSLTKEQKRAIEVIDHPVSIIAGAGSGKTRVLTERYAGIVRNAKVAPDNILAITFTEKAASEMKTRLINLIPEHEVAIQNGAISTFHAFCARILRDNAARLGLDPSATLLDESASRLLLHRTVKNGVLDLLNNVSSNDAASLVQSWGFRGLLACIEDLLSFEWHADAIIKAPMPANLCETERHMMEVIFACFERCRKDIQCHKSEHNLLDFQDLETMTLKLLSQDSEIRSLYQKKFNHILVDEFQDTNDIQMELLDHLWNPKENTLCIVGDPAQSIYRFRGANVGCFHKLTDRIVDAGGEVIHLNKNFRSRDGILSAVNRVCTPLFETEDGNIPFEPLVANRTDDNSTPFTIFSFDCAKDVKAEERRTAEAEALVEEILKLKADGNSFNDITCLFQSLSNIEIYEEAFKRSGIPYRTSGGFGFLMRQEIADILTLLKTAKMIRDGEVSDLTVYALLRSPFICLSDDECYRLRFLEESNAQADEPSQSFYDAVLSSEHGALFKLLKEILPHQGVSGLITAALEFTNAETVWHHIDPSGQALANIEKLVGMAQSLEEEDACTLDYFIDYLTDLKDRKARISEAPPLAQGEETVKCMTVHAAKGLEFPVVFLCDTLLNVGPKANRWCFVRGKGFAVKVPNPEEPLDEHQTTPYYDSIFDQEKAEDTKERARLLYVAMTRARDRLYICHHPSYSRGGLWHKWIKDVELPVTNITVSHCACPPLKQCRNSKMCHPRKSGDPEAVTFSGFLPTGRQACLRRNDINCNDNRHITSLTVSHLEAFYRCPQEYYLKYILNVPSTNFDISKELSEKRHHLPANVLGDIAHTMIEQLHADPSADRETLLLARLMQNNIPGIAHLKPEDRRQIERVIDAYEDFGQSRKYDRLFFEHPFCLKTGKALINGKIDLLGRLNDSWEIVDYKTDRIDDPETIELSANKYRLQMEIYGLAASLALKEDVETATLCFLNTKDGHAIPHRIKLSSPADILKKIDQMLIAVEKSPHSYDIPNPPPCERCAFHRNGTCDKDVLRT